MRVSSVPARRTWSTSASRTSGPWASQTRRARDLLEAAAAVQPVAVDRDLELLVGRERLPLPDEVDDPLARGAREVHFVADALRGVQVVARHPRLGEGVTGLEGVRRVVARRALERLVQLGARQLDHGERVVVRVGAQRVAHGHRAAADDGRGIEAARPARRPRHWPRAGPRGAGPRAGRRRSAPAASRCPAWPGRCARSAPPERLRGRARRRRPARRPPGPNRPGRSSGRGAARGATAPAGRRVSTRGPRGRATRRRGPPARPAARRAGSHAPAPRACGPG